MEGTNLYKEELIAGFRCKFFKEVSSTNDVAKETQDELSSFLPAAIIADHQTEGKGQMGNTWDSEPNKNLLITVIMKPNFSLSEALFRINFILTSTLITTLNDDFGLPAKLKWPNDIIIDGKKIAGVLAETSIAGEKVNTVIGGIGLNVNQSFKGQDDYKATSMLDISGKEINMDELLEKLLKNLREITEKTAFSSLNYLEITISKHLWNRNKGQEFMERDTNKKIMAFPNKFCSDHRLLVKHNGIYKKLTRENYKWLS